MSATFIYKVVTPQGIRLVRAISKADSLDFVSKSILTSSLASQEELVELLTKGIEVENSKDWMNHED